MGNILVKLPKRSPLALKAQSSRLVVTCVQGFSKTRSIQSVGKVYPSNFREEEVRHPTSVAMHYTS